MREPARDQNLMPAQRSAFRMRFLLHSAPNLMHCGAIANLRLNNGKFASPTGANLPREPGGSGEFSSAAGGNVVEPRPMPVPAPLSRNQRHPARAESAVGYAAVRTR